MPTSSGTFLGGVLSHYVLDIIPHTEGKTFKPQPQDEPGWDLLIAAAEVIIGALLLVWMLRSCPGVHSVTVGLGVLGALLPDLIDFPLKQLFGVTVLHHIRLHWTVTRRYAALGILTQLLMIGTATAYLWWAARCS